MPVRLSNTLCHYCEEEAYDGEMLENCEECEFRGHPECLLEHSMTTHECTEISEVNDTPTWEDDYLGGTEDF